MTAVQATNNWYNEINNYNFDKPGLTVLSGIDLVPKCC